MLLKSFFVSLGLDLDAMSFLKGQLAVEAVNLALRTLEDGVKAAFGAMIGVNATSEKLRMQLAAIAGTDLKLPWEEAKVQADALFTSLQEFAASTPAETEELVKFSTEVANAYFMAGGSMKDLGKFTAQAVVAAKMFNLEGIAALDITQALGKEGAHVRDKFARTIIEGELKMTTDQFNAKSAKEKLALFTKGVDSPTIRAAMKDYESNWAGVTSTLSDNFKILAGIAGKPLFDFLKSVLFPLGQWVAAHKEQIGNFFAKIWYFLGAIGRIVWTVVKAIAALVEWFYKAGTVIGTLDTALVALTVAMAIFGAESVTAALSSAAAWALAALPIIAIAALIALAILVVEDLIVGFEGGRSVIFEMFGAWKGFIEDWTKPRPGDWWLTLQLKDFIGNLLYMIKNWQEFKRDFLSSDGLGSWLHSKGRNFGATGSQTADEVIDQIVTTGVNPYASPGVVRKKFANSPLDDANNGGQYIHFAPATTINVSAGTGDPHAIADAVGKKVEEVHDKKMQEAAEALKQ